jgi:hypothetical protein
MLNNLLTWFRQRRFQVLLVSLLGLSIIQPILEDTGLIGAKILFKLFLTIVLFSSIYAVSQTKRVFVIAVILGIPSFAVHWFGYLLGANLVIMVMVQSVMAVFFVFIAWIMLSHVLKSERVSWEKIAAAICVYLILGLIWALMYSILYSLFPGAFNIGNPLMSDFVYYSFITLSTLGYGDITPLIASAQALSYVEAITGQIYLAVLIAGLVGMHIANPKEDENEGKSELDC